ncbi:MAG TPA: diguanylate cyclase [Acidobacteriaceae bacterium]|nr:diguanylate cyclase [Acidobacteriaceae bacterium]
MPISKPNSVPGDRRVASVLMAVVLILIGIGSVIAWVIYADARNSVQPNDTVQHTQDVLLNLAGVSQQIDRIELDARLYKFSGDEDHLRAAQLATNSLNTLLQRLESLVSDNPVEAQRAKQLIAAEGKLTAAVDRLGTRSGSLRDEVVECRRTLALMQDEEHTLLTRRQVDQQRRDVFVLVRRIAVIVSGTVLILVLFGFLVRDVVRRGRFEDQISDANERLRLTVQRLEEQAWESRLLIAARDEVSLCLDVQQAEEVTVRYLEQLLPGTGGNVSIVNNSRQALESVATWGGVDKVTFDGFAPESCCAVRSGRLRWRRPERSEVHCTHFAGKPPECYVCLPLTAHGETLGVVTVECPAQDVAVQAELRESTLSSLGEMAAMAIAGLRLRHKLESQSIRDGLTGLFNRTFMEVALEREMSRGTRQGKQVAVMMIDIDHFKTFNDSFGHEAGDMVLREVAETMRLGVRGEDIVCRYGGEEFIVIMPEISTNAAIERAELLRRLVNDLALRYHGQPLRQVTISIGVAMFPDNSNDADELLRSADHAMYAAKHKGRNRVVVADATIRA